MPIYSYECVCGQVLDVIHTMNDTPEIDCDNCETTMQRKLSVPNIQFNGSGFYSTDK